MSLRISGRVFFSFCIYPPIGIVQDSVTYLFIYKVSTVLHLTREYARVFNKAKSFLKNSFPCLSKNAVSRNTKICNNRKWGGERHYNCHIIFICVFLNSLNFIIFINKEMVVFKLMFSKVFKILHFFTISSENLF